MMVMMMLMIINLLSTLNIHERAVFVAHTGAVVLPNDSQRHTYTEKRKKGEGKKEK